MARSEVLVRMKADTAGYDANIAKARRQLDAFKKDNLTMGGIMKQLSGSMLSAVGGFASITAAAGALTAAFKSNIETALKFEKSMSMLSSLTGKTGEDLARLKEYAIELGSTTTLSASEVADAFKLIGSQQPQLLSSSEALKSVTKNAITLSEAAGIELATAAQTLSTSINQMGGDSSNAERFINVLAAASQKGAGDIAWLGEAITKSGTTAKMVGTSYEQLVANLEQLAQAGFDASTAGTALRSIIVNLEKQTDDKLKPSVVGLTEAFANLSDKHLSVGEMANLVGKMFGAQATVLAENAVKARDLEEAITGTNTAEEQAKTNTDNLEGSLKSLSSAWEGLNLHLNSSNGLLNECTKTLTGWIQELDEFVVWCGNSEPMRVSFTGWLGDIASAANDAYKSLKQMLGIMPEGDGNKPGTGVSWKDNSFNFKSIMGEEGVLITAPKPTGTSGGGGGGNSLTSLSNKLKELRKLRDQAVEEGDIAARDMYNAQIKSTQEQIKNLRGTTTPKKQPKVKKTDYEKLKDKTSTYYPEFSIFNKVFNEEVELPFKVSLKKQSPEELKAELDKFAPKDPYELPVKVDFKIEEFLKKDAEKKLSKMQTAAQMAADAVSNIGSAFASIEDPSAKAAGTVLQAIASIALGFAQAASAKDTTSSGWAWLGWLAAGTAALATTISTVHSLTGFEHGGEIKGNSFSGDNTPIMANAGEIVLTRAQAGNVAAQLQGSGNNVHVTGELRGESIFLAVNRSLKRRGKGELVTWG